MVVVLLCLYVHLFPVKPSELSHGTWAKGGVAELSCSRGLRAAAPLHLAAVVTNHKKASPSVKC